MQRILIIILTAAATLMWLKLGAQEVNSLREKKNDYILILNSHSYESEWGRIISNQIRHEIERQNPDILVSIAYSGATDRNSFLAGRFGMQAAFANGRINKNASIPTVLVLVGNESWMYYRIMNLRGLWEKIPVVLVDVDSEVMNDFSKFHISKTIPDSLMIPLEQSKNNLPVTALVNKGNEEYTLSLIKQLMPDLNQIVFLSNGGYQDAYTLKKLRKTISIQYTELNLKVVYTNKGQAEEWSGLPKGSTVLLGAEDVPENINVPVFQLNDRRLTGNIVVGGYYPPIEAYAAKTADIALRLHEGDLPDSIPFSFIETEMPFLNKEALDHFELERFASNIPQALYVNIPTPFLEKYMRPIFLLSLMTVILLLILILYLREKRYRSYIVNSTTKYKRIYDEYQILYDNMPMGLAFFDNKGNLLNRNESSDLFFDKIPVVEKANFNLFHTTLIDTQSKMKLTKGLLVNQVLKLDDRSLQLIFRHIQDEESNDKNLLMIILDYSAIQNEKSAKKRIHDIFNFAMDASSLGVAEYNLTDNSRFATDAWYKNLNIDKDEEDIYRSVIREDRDKIEHFLDHIGEDGVVYFTETIRIKDIDGIHWVQYVIQLLEYGPEEGRVIVAELLLNIDKQKNGEKELGQALQAAKESDRLKNAFIANMSSDIRPALDELVVLSNCLIETTDTKEKESLMERIEQNNDLLLEYVERIIDLSRTDMIKV